MKIAAVVKIKHGAIWEALQKLNWNQSDLARKCKMQPSRVGEIINLKTRPYQGEVDRIELAFLDGGICVENLVQATARDIMADSLLKIEAAGLPVVLHVHDSVTVEVAEDEGQAALDLMIKLLTEEPLYMPGLPLAAEGEIKTHY